MWERVRETLVTGFTFHWILRGKKVSNFTVTIRGFQFEEKLCLGLLDLCLDDPAVELDVGADPEPRVVGPRQETSHLSSDPEPKGCGWDGVGRPEQPRG